MLRKLIILSVFAGTSASVPILYQSNPEAIMAYLTSMVTEAEPTIETVHLPAPAGTAPLSGRRVALPADERGHFYADFKLNGRTVQALVDTGATAVAVNLSTARRIGLSLQASDLTETVNTANGKVRATVAMIDRIQIGKIYVENVQTLILDDKALSGTLIGMTFLTRLGKYQVEDGSLLLMQ